MKILNVRDVSKFAYYKFIDDKDTFERVIREYDSKLSVLTKELENIKSTKGYKMLDKIRKIRRIMK